jgi:hypothetical protein
LDPAHTADIFPHLRVLLGTVVGLGMARILLTFAGMVQHPHRAKPSLLHLLWLGSVLLELVLFWWWQFALFRMEHWNFGIAIFLVSYTIVLFLLAALLSPDGVDEYGGYQEYFIKRRAWFFGLWACVALFDIVDTLLKSKNFGEIGPQYFLQSGVGLIAALVGVRSANPKVHMTLICLHLLFQMSLAARYFYAS